jgi:DNA polymerase-3 subunit epsilon
MTREIVLDTETTGLDVATGDRIVEVGCVELVNHVPTGRHFHAYFNPDREMPESAFQVHGLSNEFLRDKPRFRERVDEFLDFVGEATLIIHNAAFDLAFLHAELERAGRTRLINEVIDTVAVAREVHPGARVNLDALCRHYGIDNTKRTLHGALLDSQILAEVYLELIGGRQVALAFGLEANLSVERGVAARQPARQRPAPLPSRLADAELAAHLAFIETLGAKALWAEYAERAAA